MIGGVLLVVHHATHPQGETSQYVVSSLWIPSHVIGYIAWMFCLIGFVGFYARLVEKTGRSVLAGFLLTVTGGTTVYSAVLWGGAVLQPILVSNSPALNDSLLYQPAFLVPGLIGFLSFAIGYPIFSVEVYRSKTMKRWVVWPAILSILGVLIFLSGTAIYAQNTTVASEVGNGGGAVLGLSMAAWGYAVWSERKPATIRGSASA